jgi:hypothetical protein
MTNWRDSGSTILFDPPLPQAPIRLPKRVSDSWLMLVDAADNLWPTFRPDASISHTETFRRMFSKPRDSFFDRNWLYCDQVGSAVTIEALEFAIQRRPGDHTQFDNAMTNPNYVKLGPVVRRPVVRRPKSRIQEKEEANSDILMSDDNDSFFDNTFVAIEDLQVGDFTCFWNNRLYDLLGSGAWRNEYCLIMGVDSSEIDGKVRNSGGPQVWLAGHGVATTLYNAMATELIGNIKVLLESLRRDLVAAVANNAAIPATRSGQLLVRWSPYEEFDPPGAWWIKIPKDTWNKKWRFQSLEEAVQAVLPTVAMSTPVGQGYNPPPEADALYFPLYEPQVTYQYSEGDSWHGYLQKRMSDAKFRAPTALRALTADTRLAPGLYYRGENAKIPVVRPKVRK